MRRLKCHPDLGGTHALAVLLNRAYETLGDTQKRAEYDLRLLIRRHQSVLLPRVLKVKPIEGPGARGLPRLWSRFTMRADSGPFSAPLWPEEEQRGMGRIQKKGRLRYRLSTLEHLRQGELQGELIDLSLQGIRFISKEKIPPFTEFEIESADLSGRASLRHCLETTSASPPTFLNGAHFVRVQFYRALGTFLSIKG